MNVHSQVSVQANSESAPRPGAGPRLVILGGGQLAKMLAQAATRLGCRTIALEKEADCPAALVSPVMTVQSWDELGAGLPVEGGVEVVTLENEFIPDAALEGLALRGFRILPTPETMRQIRDKWVQKTTLARAGLPVPAFAEIRRPEEILPWARQWGWPVVVKARQQGYDGKGNATLHGPEEIAEAWERLGGHRGRGLYLEAFCPFERELAVIVTRNLHGQVVVYPVVETVQKDHICHHVTAPARLPPELAREAAALARKAVECVHGVGSFGVELFLDRQGKLWINELAPRVHNSGHYSLEACECSQFENHVRAVLGWPLGSTRMVAPAAAMVNLLGRRAGSGRVTGLEKALAIPGVHVHIYGKSRCAPGRKMGHVTALGASPEEALARAQAAAQQLDFGWNPEPVA